MKPDSKPFCWKELLVQLLRNEDDTETLEDPSINEILVQNEILIIDDDSYQGTRWLRIFSSFLEY